MAPIGIPWLCNEVTTAAWCWKITLKSGTSFGFTSHDRDIRIGEDIYWAACGFTPSAVETSNNMAVDNLDVEGFLDSEVINADDIEAGMYDGASVEITVCDWTAPNEYPLVVRSGFIGQITHTDTGFKAEIRGLLDVFQQETTMVYQKTCRSTLGDSKCKFPVEEAATDDGVVTAINSDGSFSCTTNASAWTDGFFDYGVVAWTSGNNINRRYEVKKYVADGRRITLFMPAYNEIMVGDTFKLSVGCDGNFSTCKTKFNNVKNFRGEPHVPGTDYAVAYPASGTANTVTEGSSVKLSS